MKATFVMLPFSVRSLFSTGSRVLFENIKRNDKIEVEYNPDNIKYYDSLANKKYEEFNQNNEGDIISHYLTNTKEGRENFNSKLYTFSNDYYKPILDTINTEYVLVSFPAIVFLPFLKFLLENGKIVLAGGSYTNIYSIEELRQHMVDLGTTPEQLENLMFHKGYLDFDTDIYEIFKSKTDYVSTTPNAIDNIWKCTDDFYNTEYRKRLLENDLYQPDAVGVLLNDSCFHKKCLFCTWKYLPNNNYIKNFSVDELFERTKLLADIYNHDYIVILDAYFMHLPKIREYCIKLKEHGYKIGLITGVLDFLDIDKINFYSQYVDGITIGLDSCVDGVLEIIKKPHRFSDIQKMVSNIVNYLSKDIKIHFAMMFDLPNRTEADIIENWKNLSEVINTIAADGRYVKINNYFLANYPKNTLINTKYYKEVEDNELKNYQAGLGVMFNTAEKATNLDFSGFNKIVKPFVKVNENGDIIKSEFNYITTETVNDVYKFLN